MNKQAISGRWDLDSKNIHQLWSEKSMIESTLEERRMVGSLPRLEAETDVFLCHSSADKGPVRKVHDDLKQLGVIPWLDENQIRVGDSIVGKVDEGLYASPTMIVFLSQSSVASLWTRREWQSFLSRQLSGKQIKILPALLEDCDIPSIIHDLRYADFREGYNEGFLQIYSALRYR